MTLELDRRQRAMLAEMNIQVWSPEAPSFPVPSGRVREADAPVPAPPASAGAASQAPVGRSPSAAAAAGPRPGATLQPRPSGIETMDWDSLQAAVAGCFACKLCTSRKNTVFGVGQPPAAPGDAPRVDWLVVGEAPGENEDLRGEPFVGQAGKLLDKMLQAIGQDRRRNVYIANALKCRPPGNRNPEPEELAQCEPYLRRQVELLRPRVILAMGRFAVQALLASTEPIGRLRGRVHQYQGVPLVVTYHPAYLLRSPGEKAKAWADLCLAMAAVARPG
ncbi:MAG: uracil-DNA glycosylase [Burkholderiaceae bacterium]|nr:uracil-DNA glycosylase [Burkholderiaceae bacterium]MDO9089855.1 uracil-DNA glycosylase [Burkholderiaceae bacterium]